MPKTMHIQAMDLISLIKRTCYPSDRIAIGSGCFAIEEIKRTESGRLYYFAGPEINKLTVATAETQERIDDVVDDLRSVSRKLEAITD